MFNPTQSMAPTLKLNMFVKIPWNTNLERTKNVLAVLLILMALSTIILQQNINGMSRSAKSSRHATLILERHLLEKRDIGTNNGFSTTVPTIFIITPTYVRMTQLADMTRLSNTLRLVKNIHWIVIEDGNRTRNDIEYLLINSGISHTYMHAAKYLSSSKYLKGIHQRNLGLHWIRHHVNRRLTKGVVYFADDDNSYDIRIFEEMRYTKKLSVWPVGFVSRRKYQRPVVENGKVVRVESWNTDYRKFPLDMAGFALNIDVIFNLPKLYFLPNFYPGYQETQFLEACCEFKDLEPKANNCSQVLVWHTRTSEPVVEFTNGVDLPV